MKNRLTIILLLISINSALGQQEPYWHDYFVRIINKDGAGLKIEPNITSETLIHLPFWDKVELGHLEGFNSMNDTIDGIRGMWFIARYQGTVGYLFNGFVVVVDTNMCNHKDFRIMIEGHQCAFPNFDTLLNWYGVYRKDHIDSLIKVDIEIFKPQGLSSEIYSYVLKTDRTDKQRSVFLIGSSIPLKEKVVNMYTITEDLFPFLYPGQKKHIFYNSSTGGSNRHNFYELYATGTATGIDHHYPTLENYRLHITNKTLLPWNQRDRIINQDISDGFGGFTPSNMPGVFWYGDLDDDQVPDIVFIAVGGEARSALTLFLSAGTDSNELLRKVDSWEYYNCY